MAVLQWSTVVLCLFYTIIQQTSCDFERRCGLADRLRSPMGVCGSHLSKLMAIICDGQYQKRSQVTASEPDSWVGPDDNEEEQSLSPNENIFVSKSKALSYLQHKRNGFNDGSSVGIVCECCTYRCTITEMTQYCKAGTMGKRSWGGPTPPHAWMDSQQGEKTKTSSTKEDNDQKITEVILFTTFPEQRKTKAV